MLGTFQKSELRIEIEASQAEIGACLTRPVQLQKWLWPQKLSTGLPNTLTAGLEFSSWTGLIEVKHRVEVVSPNSLRLLLSGGVDGFHEWYWGDGWLQSHIEGVSLLPVSLGQTTNLLKLREYLRLQKIGVVA
ncbi:MAG: hypothetical protein ACRDB1_06600 [Microcoleaceae cyanobacterium]